MTTTPYISIIVPSRNRIDLLPLALEAIKAQEFRDFEVIVIDDGSSAQTRAAYASLWQRLDSRFRLELLGTDAQKGSGPSTTRNHGIALARGEIITFCDDDDFWIAADHLQAMQAVFRSRPEVDMYIGNQIGVQSQQVVRTTWLPTLSLHDRDGRATGRLVSVEELCGSGGFAQLNILAVRKSVALAVNGFWDKTTYESDRDFFWRAVDVCRQVWFRPDIVSQHNIPDPAQAANQSTRHSWMERWTLSILVSQHIYMTVRHPAIARLATRYEGDILRHLCMHFMQTRQTRPALACARRALGMRFSLKWLFYLGLLELRSLLTRTRT